MSAGIPLPPGALESASEARLLDSCMREVPAQFKALATWSDGSVRWLLVCFQCSVEAYSESTYLLQLGAPPSRQPSPLRVEDYGSFIKVSTGALELEIGQSPLIRQVKLDLNGDLEPEKLVCSSGEVVATDTAGGEHLAGLGVRSIEVEEAGPLRAVVKVAGTHLSSSGGQLLNYTMRIVAYAWKSYIRVYYTEENGLPVLNDGSGQPNCLRLGSPNSVYFEDISLKLKLEPGSFTYTFPAGQQQVSGRLEGSAYIYQDSSGGEDWDRWPGTSFRGYVIYANSELLYTGLRARGWGDISSQSFGLTLCKRFFWESYPSAIEFTEGGLAYLRVMPKYFSQPYEHRAGEHKTHELILYFHPGEFTAEHAATAEALMHPLQARAPAHLYLEYGLYERWPPYSPDLFPSYEANNLAAVNGSGGVYGDNLFTIRESVDFYGWMHFGDVRVVDEDGGTGQMNLQYDFEYGMIVQSLRLLEADPENSMRWWKLAEQACRHTADIDILHVHWADPNQPSSQWIKWCWGGMFWHTPHEQSGLENPHRGSSPSLEFQFCRGLLTYYYMTGYTKAWEAAMEVAENTYWRVMNGNGNPGYSMTASDEARAPANALQILLAAYQATWSQKYMEAARRVIEESHFQTKWYKDGPNPEYASRSVAPWQQAMLVVALGEYLDLVQELTGQVDELALSSLVGYVNWMLKYTYHPQGDQACSTPHFVYRWWGDGRVSDWSPGAGANAWMLKISDALAYAWKYTGNMTYLRIAAQLFKTGSKYFWFEGNPVGKFATGKQHAILSTSGAHYMTIAYRSPATPLVDAREHAGMLEVRVEVLPLVEPPVSGLLIVSVLSPARTPVACYLAYFNSASPTQAELRAPLRELGAYSIQAVLKLQAAGVKLTYSEVSLAP